MKQVQKSRVDILILRRILACFFVSGALITVTVRYDALPNEILLSRWQSAQKTWLLAVRIPLINLLYDDRTKVARDVVPYPALGKVLYNGDGQWRLIDEGGHLIREGQE